MGVTALQAAKRACEASGWTLTNLQLQKILYLAYMIYSGRHEEPMIHDEQFQAWSYGPVLPSVYHHVSPFGAKQIKNVFRTVQSMTDEAIGRLIDDAVHKFASKPPFKLVELTHDKLSAWSRHYQAGLRGAEIPYESVKKEYASRFEAKRVPEAECV